MNRPTKRTSSLGCLGVFSILCLTAFTTVTAGLVWWLDPSWSARFAFWRGETHKPQPLLEHDPHALALVRSEQRKKEELERNKNPYRDILVDQLHDEAVTAQYTRNSGAQIEAIDGAQISIPAGAVRENAQIKLTPVTTVPPEHTPTEFRFAGPLYDLKIGEHASYQFDRPVDIEMPYSPVLFPGDTARGLQIVTHENGRWVGVPSEVDTKNHLVRARVTHASPKGIGFFARLTGGLYVAKEAYEFYQEYIKPILDAYNSSPGQFLVWYRILDTTHWNSIYETERFAIHYFDRATALANQKRKAEAAKMAGLKYEPDAIPGPELEPLQNGAKRSSGAKKPAHPRYIQDLGIYLEEAADDYEALGFKFQTNEATYKLAMDYSRKIIGKAIESRKSDEQKKREKKEREENDKRQIIRDAEQESMKQWAIDELAKYLGKRQHVIVTPCGDIEQTEIGGVLVIDNDMKLNGKELGQLDLPYVMQWAARRALMQRYLGSKFDASDPLTWRSTEWLSRSTAEFIAHHTLKGKIEDKSNWHRHYLEQLPWILNTPMHGAVHDHGPRGGYAYASYLKWLQDQKVDVTQIIKDLFGDSVGTYAAQLRDKFDEAVKEALGGASDPFADFSFAYYHEGLANESIHSFAVANRLRTETMPGQSHTFNILAMRTGAEKYALNIHETTKVAVTPWAAAYFPFNIRGVSQKRKPKLIIEAENLDPSFHGQHFVRLAPFHIGLRPKFPAQAFGDIHSEVIESVQDRPGIFFVVEDLSLEEKDGVSLVLGDSDPPRFVYRHQKDTTLLLSSKAKHRQEQDMITLHRWLLMRPAWVDVDRTAKDGSIRVEWHKAELRDADSSGPKPFKEYRVYRKRVGDESFPEKPYRTLQQESFVDRLKPGERDDYLYVVTVVDRLDNESEPTVPTDRDPFVGKWFGSFREERGLELEKLSVALNAAWTRQMAVWEQEVAQAKTPEERQRGEDGLAFLREFVQPFVEAAGEIGKPLGEAVKVGFPPINYEIYREDGDYMLVFTRVGGLALAPADSPPIKLERTHDDRALSLKLPWPGFDNFEPLILHSPEEDKIKREDEYSVNCAEVFEEDDLKELPEFKFRWNFRRISEEVSVAQGT